MFRVWFGVAARRTVIRQSSTYAALMQNAPFNSVRFNLSDHSNLHPQELDDFLTQMHPIWIEAQKNTAWMRVSIEQGDLLKILFKQGFVFHHAGGTNSMLMKWLRDDVPCKVPPFASTQVGVAGVCLDVHASGIPHLLVIKERAARVTQWKFPGGLSDAGEHLGATAEREVYEETGVRSTFSSLLTFRHQHGMGFEGKVADIYAMCLVRPDRTTHGSRAVDITIDPVEIAEAAWVDPWQYIASVGHPLNRYVAALALQETARTEAVAGRSLTREGGLPVVTNARTLLGQDASSTGACEGMVGIAEDRVYVPATKLWVRAYRAASGPVISNTKAELAAASLSPPSVSAALR